MKLSNLALAAALTLTPVAGFAQDVTAESVAEAIAASQAQTGYILTTVLFLVGGFLVFWMAAGFAMLEAGLVRSKNVTMQLTKNMGLFGQPFFNSTVFTPGIRNHKILFEY